MAATPPGRGLSFMQRLSPSVTYFVPPNASSNASTSDPDLILLLSWMGAREEHIAKYVHHHHALFPTSRIIVAQCPLSHVYFPPYVYFHARPVIPILKELVNSPTASNKPRLLLHAFSNGGVSTAIQIYSQLKRQLGGRFTLPRHVFIFDSCPGTFRWKSTARAIMQKLPSWMAPFIHSFLFSIWLMYKLPLIQPAQNRNARLIRNPNLKNKEVRRAYLYGTEDDLIYPADVEEQARLAKQDGFNVTLEKFDGAMHCAIARTEPDRYWKCVRETWYGPEALAETVLIEKEEEVRSVEGDEVEDTGDEFAKDAVDDVAEDAVDYVAEDTGEEVAEDTGDDVAKDAVDDVAEDTVEEVAEDTGDDVAEDTGDEVTLAESGELVKDVDSVDGAEEDSEVKTVDEKATVQA